MLLPSTRLPLLARLMPAVEFAPITFRVTAVVPPIVLLVPAETLIPMAQPRIVSPRTALPLDVMVKQLNPAAPWIVTRPPPSMTSLPSLSGGNAVPMVMLVTLGANVIVSGTAAPPVPPVTWACSPAVRLACGRLPVASKIASRRVSTLSRVLVSALLLTWMAPLDTTVAVGVGVAVRVGVTVGVRVGVRVTVPVGVAVTVLVTVGVGVRVNVTVTVWLGVGLGVGDGV